MRKKNWKPAKREGTRRRDTEAEATRHNEGSAIKEAFTNCTAHRYDIF